LIAVALIGAASLLSVGVFVGLSLASPDWASLRPATCMPDDCFCEHVRAGSIRQPANTASGLLFLPVAAGLLVMSSRRRSGSAPAARALIVRQPVYTWLFVTATVLVGLGTAVYHASLSFIGQTVDVLGMYLIATFAVLYAAARLWRISDSAAASSYILCNAILLWGLIAWPQARRYTFAVLVIVALILEIGVGTRRPSFTEHRYLGAAVAALAAGFGIWALDVSRTACIPESLLQGHALWHIAGAASVGLLFRYYVSEVPRQPAITANRNSFRSPGGRS
jgi:hypothetical protein